MITGRVFVLFDCCHRDLDRDRTLVGLRRCTTTAGGRCRAVQAHRMGLCPVPPLAIVLAIVLGAPLNLAFVIGITAGPDGVADPCPDLAIEERPY